MHLMIDYVCSVWKSTASSHVQKLQQVLQSKYLLSVTTEPQYISNKQVYNDVKVPIFCRTMTDCMDSNLAAGGNPTWQLGINDLKLNIFICVTTGATQISVNSWKYNFTFST